MNVIDRNQYLAAIRAMQDGNFSPAFPADAESDLLGVELRKLAASLEQKCIEAGLLQSIMHEVSSGLLVDDVLDRIYDRFRTIIPYDRMSLSLLSEDRTTLTQCWLRSDGNKVMLPRGYSALIEGSSLQQVLEARLPRILNDLEAYLSEHPNSHATRLIVKEGMRSNFTCPLVAQDSPIGFLFFSSHQKNTYSHLHQQIFMHIAEQVSILVEKQCLAQKLRANDEERYKTIVRTTLDSFLLTDTQGRLLDVNDAACKLSGYRREELLTMHVSDLEASETPEETTRHIRKVMTCGSDRFETRHRCKYGHIIDIEVSTNYVAADGGRFFSFLHDISARKRAEKDIRLKALLLDNVNDSVFLIGKQGDIRYANETACRTHGYTEEEMLGMDLRALLSPEYARGLHMRLAMLTLCGQALFETDHLRKDGTILPVEFNVSLVESGKYELFLGVARDISVRKRIEEDIRLKALLLDNVNDSVFLTDQLGNIRYANETACRIHGYTQQEMLGLNLRALISPEHAQGLGLCMDKLLLRGQALFETAHICKDGTSLPVELNVRLIESNGSTLFLGVARDIMDRKLAEKHVHFAYHDPLTGLSNRWRLMERIEYALVRAKRHERLVAVMFLDLDNFKQINDTLGHDVGDEVLITAAGRIACCVRQDDTVSRLGGDEFVVLLNEISSAGEAVSVAEKVLLELAAPMSIAGKTFMLSSSIGISFYPDDGMDPQMLITLADNAMYKAKRSGKRCVRLYGENV